MRHALVHLPFYTVFDNLSFSTAGDTVTLLGQVTRQMLKDETETAVSKIAGVRHVINQIEVLPLSASDEKLRLAEYLAVYGETASWADTTAKSPPIHIIVKDGTVTLEGSVATESDKTQAFTLASGVPGITSLTNHLRIEPLEGSSESSGRSPDAPDQ